MVRRRGGSNHMDRKDDAHTCDVAVIGAGPSGCMASAAAARKGLQTLLFDANDRIGRKIYATGGGRCNLTNLRMDEDCYHTGGSEDLSAFFARFSVQDHIRFWESEGIWLHDRQGYVYPRTDQAATIAEAFEKILREARRDSFSGAERSATCDCRREGERDAFLLKHSPAGTILPGKSYWREEARRDRSTAPSAISTGSRGTWGTLSESRFRRLSRSCRMTGI